MKAKIKCDPGANHGSRALRGYGQASRLASTVITVLVSGSCIVASGSTYEEKFGDSKLGVKTSISHDVSINGPVFKESIEGKVTGEILNRGVTLASAKVVNEYSNKLRSSGSLKLVGATVFAFDKTFTSSSTNAVPIFDLATGGTAKYGAYGINVTLEGKMELVGQVKQALTINYSSTTRKAIVKGEIGPELVGSANCKASADAVIARISLTGSVNGKANVVASTQYQPRSQSGIADVSWALVADRSLHGDLKLKIKDKLGIFSKSWTVWDYAYDPTPWTLVQGTKRF